MAHLRKIAGLVLIGLPIGTFAVVYLITMIEIPPVRWTTLVVVGGYAMIGAGNWLLKTK